MEITIKGDPKEIAALVLEIQERQKGFLKIDDPTGHLHVIDELGGSEEEGNLLTELSDPKMMERIRKSINEAIFSATQSN